MSGGNDYKLQLNDVESLEQITAFEGHTGKQTIIWLYITSMNIVFLKMLVLIDKSMKQDVNIKINDRNKHFRDRYFSIRFY